MGTHYSGNKAEVDALNAYIKLVRAAESVSARVHGHLEKYKLTVSQFGVLDALFHLGPLPQGELGKKILKSGGNMTMVVDNLEKRGLVKRERNAEDRRLRTVVLTSKGRRLFERILPAHVKAIASEFRILTEGEQEDLGRLCRKIGLQKGG